jgi:hypothetical protein
VEAEQAEAEVQPPEVLLALELPALLLPLVLRVAPV